MIKNKINILATLLLVCSTASYAGITGSPHDLSYENNNTNPSALSSFSQDNGEICVYCHTPHAGNTAFTGAPLWNKADGVAKTYQMYGQTTTGSAGVTIAGTSTDTSPANPSLACLSCHDGISAIDSIVNAPGSGMGSYSAGTVNIVTALTNTYGGNIGQVPGTATTGTVVDLSNDHPVSIKYMGTGLATSPASLRATTFVLTSYGDGVAWKGATTIANLLRGTNGNVECSSCHDPHNGGNIQGTSTEVNFLRHSNTKSNLCLGCHEK